MLEEDRGPERAQLWQAPLPPIDALAAREQEGVAEDVVEDRHLEIGVLLVLLAQAAPRVLDRALAAEDRVVDVPHDEPAVIEPPPELLELVGIAGWLPDPEAVEHLHGGVVLEAPQRAEAEHDVASVPWV